MFPSFISILDIQSWWEVPSIAHFCSLFRAAFNLLDFDIEELEEALLTDGTEDAGNYLLQELIVRLLCGCLANNDVSTFNYQMFLRRLFRQKCQEHGRYNPFNTDIDFQFLPLRTKVEILHALCDFRLDAADVLDLLSNLEAESLRVEPLGYDDNNSAYWYFYGTRLYREDYDNNSKKNKHKKSVWQVVCFTEQDWNHLTSKFKGASSKTEKALYRSLSENFLPEIPKLFKEKERLQRRRLLGVQRLQRKQLLELQPRRTSSRVQKLKEQQEEGTKNPETTATTTDATAVTTAPSPENEVATPKPAVTLSARELRAIQRDVSRSGSEGGSRTQSPAMPSQAPNSGTTSVGRQTNNSLASATGQILIQPVVNLQRIKLKTSQIFRQTEEDLQTGMYKILEFVKNHDDAWPFIEPVEEDYAPNYYTVIRKPMDLQKMEDKLDAGEYSSFSKFKADFQLIVHNCRLYNGTDNEYTEMVDNLQQAFERATDRFLDQISSSDEDVAVEYQRTSKENVINSKKNKKLKKEIGKSLKEKQKASPVPQEKQKTLNRLQKYPRDESPVENKTKKIQKQVKKKSKKHTQNQNEIRETRKTHESRRKSFESDESIDSFKRLSSPEINRSRSNSNRRSWSSSPSPPPPRIQKKKKFKDKPLTEPVSQSEENFDKNEDKWDEIINDIKNDFKANQRHNENYESSSLKREKTKKENTSSKESIEKLKKTNTQKRNSADPFVPFTSDKKDKNKKNVNKKKKNNTKDKSVKRKYADLDSDSSKSPSSPYSQEKNSPTHKKVVKKAGVIKNPAAIEALALATEQTLKDINKWLDDTPKYSDFNTPTDSPKVDDFDNIEMKMELDLKLNMKVNKAAQKAKDQIKDISKKRIISKDLNKLHKRREVQRTIDRLQPGKSKGNLIVNIQNNKNSTEDSLFPTKPLSKVKDSKNASIVPPEDSTPQLSLGKVLDSFGQQHNFVDDSNKSPKENKKDDTDEKPEKKVEIEKPKEEKAVDDSEVQQKPVKKPVLKQENVTPNLSAWFKAFGAPKSTSVSKKKSETENDGGRDVEHGVTPISADERGMFKTNNEFSEDFKKSSPTPSPVAEVPTYSAQPAPRMRKASTGSSVSERSSFSQDMTDPLDSPRLSMDERSSAYSAPYPSPLHRSPIAASPVMASPRFDENQRNAPYPPLNGNIRVGFYQDTVKSSPEKSCSPRDQPQSPHSQYPPHVYIAPSSTAYQYNNPPSGLSPVQSPAYTQQPSTPYNDVNNSYYDSCKPSHVHDYGSINKPIETTSYNQVPESQPNTISESYQQPKTIEPKVQSSNPVIPVKKRLYNETPEVDSASRLSSPHNIGIQNVSREMNTYSNREMESNLLTGRQLNVNTDQAFSNKPYLVSSPQMTPPVETHTKTYTDLDSARLISHRGLNLPLSSTQPLNIPNPIKSIDLTGPDSPVYGRRNALDLGPGMTHPRPPLNIYERGGLNSSGNLLEIGQPSHYGRPQDLNVKSTSNSTPNAISTTSQQLYDARNIPLDMNMHHSRLNLGSTDLRIPSVRNNNIQSMNQSPQLQSLGNQDLSKQRNEYQHQNLRTSSNRLIPGGMNIDLTSSSSAYNTSIEASASLRGNLANLSHIVDRYPNDERLLSGIPSAPSPFYPEKNLHSQPMFSKGLPGNIQPSNSVASSLPIFSQSNVHINNISSTSMVYPNTAIQQPTVSKANTVQQNQSEKKSRRRKTKNNPVTAAESSSGTSNQGFQSYADIKSNTVTNEPSAISLKTASVVPGSAFNFGPAPPSISLSSGLYSDKDGYSGFLEDYRNSATNYYMAASHRSTPDINADKTQRNVSTAANPPSGSYPFLSHPQTRPPPYPSLTPPFMNPHQVPVMDRSSPIYQQYMQRQEELLRHSGVLHHGYLPPPAGYPPGYPLEMRQTFDAMNRPSPWI